MATSQRGIVTLCLAGLAAALLLVGVVSTTLLRHTVQIAPIVMVACLVRRSHGWGAYAAIPIFLFWIFIVILIWLYLLGLSQVASGHYTTIEKLSTAFMAAFSVTGIVKSIPLGRSLQLRWRALAFVVSGALQVAAMWLSLTESIAHR